MEIVDAHHHFWDPARPHRRDDHVAELRHKDLPSVAVGQAWLDRADAGRALERLTGFEAIVGDFTGDERGALFADNARRLYAIAGSAP